MLSLKQLVIKRIRPVKLLAVLVVLALSGVVSAQTGSGAGYVKVIKVQDGDTVTIRSGWRTEKVRLIGMDAPELGQRPWGARSRTHLERLLKASRFRVRLEFDAEERDKYGRLLAYLITADGANLNLRMVEDGYAVLLTIPPNVTHADELKEAQKGAREAGLGLWKRGLRESPSEWRKKHKR